MFFFLAKLICGGSPYLPELVIIAVFIENQLFNRWKIAQLGFILRPFTPV